MAYLALLVLSAGAAGISAAAIPLSLISVLASWEDPESQERKVLAALLALCTASTALTIYLTANL